ILEMKLYRLAKLEILVIEKELKEKRSEQRRLKELLGNERGRWAVVRDEIAEIQKAYSDKRRTKIGGAGSEEVEYSEEAFIADEDAQVVLTRGGYGLRFALAPHTEVSTRAGRRFARPAKEDELIGVVPVEEKDFLAVVTENAYALVTKAKEVNELAGPGRGVRVIKVQQGDKL